MSEKSEFWANGYDDYRVGQRTNPYPALSAAFHEWNSGYADAADDDFESSYIPEDPDDGDYPADEYWSGTGELMSDESYITYLNNY